MSDFQGQAQQYVELRRQGVDARTAYAQAFPQGLQRAQAESLASATNDAALGQIAGMIGGAVGTKGIYDAVTSSGWFAPEVASTAAAAPTATAAAAAPSSIALGGTGGGGLGSGGAALTDAGFGGGDVAFGGAGVAGSIPAGVIPALGVIASGPMWAPGLASALEGPSGAATDFIADNVFGRTPNVLRSPESLASGELLSSQLGEQFQGLSPEQRAQVSQQLLDSNALQGIYTDQGTENDSLAGLKGGQVTESIFPKLNLPYYYQQADRGERAVQNLGVDPSEMIFKRVGVSGREREVFDPESTYAAMGLDRLQQVFGDTAYGGNIQAAQGALAGALGAPQAPQMPQQPDYTAELQGMVGAQPQAIQRPLMSSPDMSDPALQDLYRRNPELYQNRGSNQLDLGAALLGL